MSYTVIKKFGFIAITLYSYLPITLSQNHPEVKEAYALFQSGNSTQALTDLKTFAQTSWNKEEYDAYFESMNFYSTIYLILGAYDSCFYYYQLIQQKAIQISDTARYLEYGLNEIGLLNSQTRFDEILAKCNALIPLAKNYPRELSMLYQNKAYTYESDRQSKDSIYYYLNLSLQIAKEINDSIRIAAALGGVALHLSEEGAYTSSLKYRLEQINYLSPDQILPRFNLYNKLAETYKLLDERDKSYEYAVLAYRYAQEKNLKSSQSRAALFLSSLYQDQGDLDEAFQYAQAATRFYVARPNVTDITAARLRLSSIYVELNQLDKAGHQLDSLQTLIPKMNLGSKERFFYYKGILLKEQGMISAAIPNWEEALTLARRGLMPFDEQAILLELKDAYKVKDPMKAIQYYEAYYQLTDSLDKASQTSQFLDLETQYQTTEKEQQIVLLNTQNELNQIQLQSRTRQLYFLLAGLGGLLILLYLIFRNARIRKRTNTLLAQKNKIISKALEEKDLLLKEIHHRVKNNLQLVSSLLQLQSEHVKDTTALGALKAGQDRVHSMAIIHQNLYQNDNLTAIAVKSYFEKLVNNLFDSYNIDPNRIKTELNIEPLSLDVDSIIPIGLIVNELISNAIKYAFPGDKTGTIQVHLFEDNRQLQIEVSDNGVGMDSTKKNNLGESFGYRMVNAFSEQIDADLDINTSDRGTSIRLHIRDYRLVG